MHTEKSASDANLTRYPTVNGLKSQPTFQEGEWVKTAGFHIPGDSGGAWYRTRKFNGETQPNDADVIALQNGLSAVFLKNEAVNYEMFGAVSDDAHDDGVQIIPELAPYAEHLITVVDGKDRIGIRSGANYSKRGWAREELFYVEEEGRIIGDIAWEFKTSRR